MSDNMNDKNENLDETVVDETAETASNETVDDVATDDIAADASSADSIESIDFAVVYDDDNADIEIAASDGAEISDDVNDGDTAVAATAMLWYLQIMQIPLKLQMTLQLLLILRMVRMWSPTMRIR